MSAPLMTPAEYAAGFSSVSDDAVSLSVEQRIIDWAIREKQKSADSLKRRTRALFAVTLIACGAVFFCAYQAIDEVHREAVASIHCFGSPLNLGDMTR